MLFEKLSAKESFESFGDGKIFQVLGRRRETFCRNYSLKNLTSIPGKILLCIISTEMVCGVFKIESTHSFCTSLLVLLCRVPQVGGLKQ